MIKESSMPVMPPLTATVKTSSSTGSIQTAYPQSGRVKMAAARFHIPPPAKFAPKTYDGDHWIKCYELFEAATKWDGLSDKVHIHMLIYVPGKKAVDIYDSFKLSGEDIQYASVKQKFKDDSLIQVYCYIKKGRLTREEIGQAFFDTFVPEKMLRPHEKGASQVMDVCLAK